MLKTVSAVFLNVSNQEYEEVLLDPTNTAQPLPALTGVLLAALIPRLVLVQTYLCLFLPCAATAARANFEILRFLQQMHKFRVDFFFFTSGHHKSGF
jgi:hypothetical protein